MNEGLNQKLADHLREYVSEHPFNNMAVAHSFINHHENTGSGDVAESFTTWLPDSLAMLSVYGGTNCVGATFEFMVNRLREIEGVTFREVITTDTNLPEGVSPEEVPHQHLALFAIDDQTGEVFLVDPGLGLVKPIGVDMDESQFGGRGYSLAAVDDETNRLSILKPNGASLSIDFVFLPENMDPELVLQKPLFRATREFKVDAFSPEGHKTASVKVDIFNRMVMCYVMGQTFSHTFEELNLLFENELFVQLSDTVLQNPDTLKGSIQMLVSREQLLVDLWYEGLQREYYLRHSDMLSPFETDWSVLEKRGYKGGGVVVILMNENKEILLYKVPEGKSKPHIGRHAGQLNFFTETADLLIEGGTVADLEPFEENLERAFSEELGTPLPSLDTMEYREIDYGTGFRARCAIFKVDNSYIDEVKKAVGTHSYELGDVEWVQLADLDKYWVDPSAEIILNKVRGEFLPSKKE